MLICGYSLVLDKNMKKVYLVGGAVRDMLMGLEPKDRDWVVVGATPEEMLAEGYQQVGKDFPVFLHPETGEEYALARKERKTGSGYNGFTCEFTPDITLEDDCKRRDLTINAIAYEPETGTYIDPYCGIDDIQNKNLRAVSKHFAEDPLRVLRVARFMARYDDFTIVSSTFDMMVEIAQSPDFCALSQERILLETQKAMKEKHCDRYFDILNSAGAIPNAFNVHNYFDGYTLVKQAVNVGQYMHNIDMAMAYLVWKLNDCSQFLQKIVVSSETKRLIELLRALNPEYMYINNALNNNDYEGHGSGVLDEVETILKKCDILRREEILTMVLDILEFENRGAGVKARQFIDDCRKEVVSDSRAFTATLADMNPPMHGLKIKESLGEIMRSAILTVYNNY